MKSQIARKRRSYKKKSGKRGSNRRSSNRRSKCNRKSSRKSCNRRSKGRRRCSWVKGKKRSYCRKMNGGMNILRAPYSRSGTYISTTIPNIIENQLIYIRSGPETYIRGRTVKHIIVYSPHPPGNRGQTVYYNGNTVGNIHSIYASGYDDGSISIFDTHVPQGIKSTGYNRRILENKQFLDSFEKGLSRYIHLYSKFNMNPALTQSIKLYIIIFNILKNIQNITQINIDTYAEQMGYERYRLTKDQVLKIYNNFKDQYESNEGDNFSNNYYYRNGYYDVNTGKNMIYDIEQQYNTYISYNLQKNEYMIGLIIPEYIGLAPFNSLLQNKNAGEDVILTIS